MTSGFNFGGAEPAEFERNKIVYQSFGTTDCFLRNPNQTSTGEKVLIDVPTQILVALQLPQDSEIISCVVYGSVAVGRKFSVERGVINGSTASDSIIALTPFNSVGLTIKSSANIKLIDNTQYKYWIETQEMNVAEEFYGAVITFTVPIGFKTSRLL